MGKTSLVYHLAWMFAEPGAQVQAVRDCYAEFFRLAQRIAAAAAGLALR